VEPADAGGIGGVGSGVGDNDVGEGVRGDYADGAVGGGIGGVVAHAGRVLAAGSRVFDVASVCGAVVVELGAGGGEE